MLESMRQISTLGNVGIYEDLLCLCLNGLRDIKTDIVCHLKVLGEEPNSTKY